MKRNVYKYYVKHCHLAKASKEHENGQNITMSDTIRTFRTQVQDVFESPLSKTNAFVEKSIIAVYLLYSIR